MQENGEKIAIFSLVTAAPCEGAAVCYFSGIIVCKNASEVQD